jgi:hypothetical protein
VVKVWPAMFLVPVPIMATGMLETAVPGKVLAVEVPELGVPLAVAVHVMVMSTLYLINLPQPSDVAAEEQMLPIANVVVEGEKIAIVNAVVIDAVKTLL